MTQAALRIDNLLSDAAPTHDQTTHAFDDLPPLELQALVKSFYGNHWRIFSRDGVDR